MRNLKTIIVIKRQIVEERKKHKNKNILKKRAKGRHKKKLAGEEKQTQVTGKRSTPKGKRGSSSGWGTQNP